MMFSSDRILIPRSSPETTDSVAQAVMSAMRRIWTGVLVGMPNRWLKPALT